MHKIGEDANRFNAGLTPESGAYERASLLCEIAAPVGASKGCGKKKRSGSEELALPGVSGDAGDALEAAMNRRWVGRAPSISEGQKWRDVSCGPDLKRVAVLRAVGDPNVEFAMTSLNRAAPDLGITLVPVDINRPTTSNPRLPISKEARQRPSS